MSRLRELQEVFAAVATGRISAEALGPTAGQSRARVEVYVEAYFSRLRDVLLDDYPKLTRAIGERFAALCRDYIRAYPSDRPSLRHFGRHLPAFLLEAPLSKERPWLADLARLEWARVEAFDAADRSTMTLEDLQAVPADNWAELRLAFVPSVHVLELAWPVDEIWRALDDRETVSSFAPRLTTTVVWRNGFTVRHRRCDVDEARAIALVSRAAAFAQVCEVWADHPGTDVALAAQHATAALCQWVFDGWIASTPSTTEVSIRAQASD
jgi:hypothetical protein